VTNKNSNETIVIKKSPKNGPVIIPNGINKAQIYKGY
jgi:hypothetical protein